MLSNCMMSKTRAITKICCCAELTDKLNTCGKKFIMVIMMLCYFEILPTVKDQYEPFQNITLNLKRFQQSSEKTLQERRIRILKFSQDNPQNIFLNFLTSKNIFITLQYSGDILEIFLKQTFMECSSKVLETLLRDYWNFAKGSTFVIIKSYTFNTKLTFPSRTF